jgi:hypothetical protein
MWSAYRKLMDCVDVKIVHVLWGNLFVGWEALNAVNTAGEVLLMCDTRVVEKFDSIVGQFSVSCQWKR